MTKRLSIAAFICSAGLILTAADNNPAVSQRGDTPLVEIDGVKITLADFDAKRPAGLFQARNNFYEAERRALDEFVNDYLLIRQAQKEGTTVADLLEKHGNGGEFKQPSEEVLRVYYEGVDTTEPYEAVREKIVEAIRTRRLAKAKSAYLQTLRSQASVAFLLAPPRAPITLKNTPVRGVPNAPVTVVEYADYECPVCQQIQPVVDKVLADYQGKIAFALKDFPLPMHSHAQKASEAAHCAEVQGKYWDFHDLLFNTRQFEVSQLKEGAQKLNLNVESFSKCLDSGAQAETVKAQYDEALALGLPGTPAFFVNGRLINPNGTVSYQTLSQLIDEELAAPARRLKETASANGEAALHK